MGPGAHLGLAVRLPRARPVRRLPRRRGWRRSPTRRTCCSSRSCWPTRRRSAHLYAGSASTPTVARRPRASPVNESASRPPDFERDAAGAALRGVLRGERRRRWPTCSVGTCRGRADGPELESLMTDLPDIPFNRAGVEGRELDYVQDAVRGGHTSPRAGTFSRRAAELLAGGDRRRGGAADHLVHGGARAVARCCSTSARRHGDRAVVHLHQHRRWRSRAQGAGLVFCDIEPETLGLDPAHLADAARRARARGRGRPLRRHRLRRRRASARSWPTGPTSRLDRGQRPRPVRHAGADQPLGSLGRFATLSFHETKNFVCGEGGALLLNDADDVDRARVLYDKGTNRQRVHARPGRQVLLEGHRLVVRALRRAGGLPPRPARAARGRSRASVAPSSSTTPTALAPYADELGFELMRVPPDRESGATTCSTCCCPTATAATTCSS